MHATTTFAAILAFATITLANPVMVQVEKRDPGNFRLFENHYHSTQCIPGACGPLGVINSYSVTVHDNCNGGGCGGQRSNLPWNGSYCGIDISVCGRTLRLEKGQNPNDCGALSNLKGASGQGYAVLRENGRDVGSCVVDFSQSYAKTCGFGSTNSYQSHIQCFFNGA